MSNCVVNRTFMYGLDSNYNIVRYEKCANDETTKKGLLSKAISLWNQFPGIDTVYVIDDSEDVHEAFLDCIRKHSMEDRVVFKVLLDSNGTKLI